MRAQVRQKLVQEIADWRHAGLIDERTARVLDSRYDSATSIRQTLLRWLGFFALFMLGSSLLGLVGMALGPLGATLAPVVVAALSWAFLWQGVRFATDSVAPRTISGSVLITAAHIGFLAALGLLYDQMGGAELDEVIPVLAMIVAAAAIATAYRYGLRWPLGLGLLMLFHAIGSAHAFVGGGSYFLGIDDPRLMVVVAGLVATFGFWHEQRLDERFPTAFGLGSLYIVLGLLYANLSLWLLSLRPGGLEWVLPFTAFGVIQIAVGAGLRDGRVTGMGIVFLAINLYTRLFEHFWDDLSRGVFLFIAGSLGLVFGAWCERQRPAPRRGANA